MNTNNERASRRGQAPCFIDGLCSSRSYLVVASKPSKEATTYNAIGIRKVNGRCRIHAYPNFEFFGIQQDELYGHTPKHRPEAGYETIWVSVDSARDFFNKLLHRRGIVVAPETAAFPTLERGFNPDIDAEDGPPHELKVQQED